MRVVPPVLTILPPHQVSNQRTALSTAQKAFPCEKDMKALSAKCPKLTSFKANILRTSTLGFVEWTKDEASGEWKGGVTEGEKIPLPKDAEDTGTKK